MKRSAQCKQYARESEYTQSALLTRLVNLAKVRGESYECGILQRVEHGVYAEFMRSSARICEIARMFRLA